MKLLALILVCFYSLGCQSLGKTVKGWFGSEEAPVAAVIPDQNLTKFSDVANYTPPSDRQYKRMTKKQMEDDSDLNSQAGSLWVMEGQSSYLFSQNKMRREGDLLSVKLEGGARKQVVTKVNVIKKLLKQLEDANEVQIRAPAAQAGATPGATTEALPQQPVSPAANTQKVADSKGPAEEEIKEENFEVQEVPTRIVEKLADGNYKIKGDRPFMIGKREYKVIVSGIVRPEDYSDEGVATNKILDPQFDVVSIRRSNQ